MISLLTKVCELSWQTSYSIQHDKCLAPATSDLGFYTVVFVFDLTVIWSPFQLTVKNYSSSSVSQWFTSRWLRYKIKYTIVNIVHGKSIDYNLCQKFQVQWFSRYAILVAQETRRDW